MRTPAYRPGTHYTAAYEAMADLSDEEAVEICTLLGACDRGDFTLARLLAQAIVTRLAHQHAAHHAAGA